MKQNFTDTPMMRFVRKTFVEQVNRMEINGELKASLLRENKFVEQFIKHHAGDIDKYVAHRAAQNRPPIKQSILIETVEDFTKVLVLGVENQATRKQESEIAKYTREHAGDHQKDMDKTLDGNASGVYEDLGVEIARDEVISLEPETNVIQ